jgi:hypothetical protein
VNKEVAGRGDRIGRRGKEEMEEYMKKKGDGGKDDWEKKEKVEDMEKGMGRRRRSEK